MDKEPILKQKCKRCGHEWYPKSPELPVRCPTCQSPYWQRERKKPL